MRNLLTLVLPLVIFVIVIAFLWMGLHRNPREIPSPLLNKPVPAFKAQNLMSSGWLTQDDLKNQVILLNVFATWCPSCKQEHSVLMSIRQEMDHSIKIVGINYKDDRQLALMWLKQYGNPYDFIIEDPQGNLAINFGVYGTPETFIIDKQGIIRYKFIGAIGVSEWQNILLPIIKKWEAMP